MIPLEIKTAVKALREEIGPKCCVSFNIKASSYMYGEDDERAIQVFCQPRGGGSGNPSFLLYVDTWQEAFDGVRQEWAKISADVARETIRQMALAIIRITADLGACTDAALRADSFTEEDLEIYGADACNMADEMASNGPFSIKLTVGANAA